MNNGIYRSWKMIDATATLIYRAVVQGTNANECTKPGAANAVGFVGVTQEAQSVQNRSILLKEAGTTFVVAAGAIAVGDAVRIADATGKVESAQSDVIATPGTAKVNYPIGIARTAAAADGDLIEILIQPAVVKTAAS